MQKKSRSQGVQPPNNSDAQNAENLQNSADVCENSASIAENPPSENAKTAPVAESEVLQTGVAESEVLQTGVAESTVVDEPDLRYKNGKAVAKGGVLGFFIGLAVIVPGVSGSTVAIIFRLYEKLLYALGNFFKKFKKCLRFLLPIAAGVLVGFVLGFFAVQKLLDLVPFIVIGLFAGLMLGAYPAVTAEIKGAKKTPFRISAFALGLALPVAVSLFTVFGKSGGASLENLQFYHYLLFLVLGAAVAVTQIVPGLSASALLMMAGYFGALMDSVHLSYWQQNPQIFAVYACLVIGFALGLIGFSKALSSLLGKHRQTSFFAICGLSLGSILTMFLNSEVFAVYQNWANNGVAWLDLILGCLLLVVGAAVSFAFVRYEKKRENRLNPLS